MNDLVSWPIARVTAVERLRNGSVLVLAGLLTLVGAALTSGTSPGTEPFSGIASVFLLFFTLFLGAGLIADEVESGHAQLTLLRPLTRAAWYGGRLAGAGAVLLAALTLAWLTSASISQGHGGHFTLGRLAALPVAFAWAFAWLSVLTCLSVVARGWTNAGWMILGALVWFSLRLLVKLGDTLIAMAAGGQSGLGAKFLQLLSQAQPYLGPQDPMELVLSISSGTRPDFAPLVYDLLWASGAWLLGCVLLNRRELARRTQ